MMLLVFPTCISYNAVCLENDRSRSLGGLSIPFYYTYKQSKMDGSSLNTSGSEKFYLRITKPEMESLHKEAFAESVSYKTEIDLTISEERKLWCIHLYHSMIFIFIFVIVWHLVTRMTFIYFEFKGLIDWIDSNIQKRSSLSQQDQLTYYNFTSGFSIAYYYVYPNMPTNPFLNNAFPSSIIYSYYTPTYQSLFIKDYSNVQQMFTYGAMGSYCQPSTNGNDGLGIGCMRAPDANEIVCNTYGSAFAPCTALCIKGTEMSGSEWAMSTGGSAFGGTVVGGAPGAFAAITAQVFVNILSNQENEQVANAQQFCIQTT